MLSSSLCHEIWITTSWFYQASDLEKWLTTVVFELHEGHTTLEGRMVAHLTHASPDFPWPLHPGSEQRTSIFPEGRFVTGVSPPQTGQLPCMLCSADDELSHATSLALEDHI